jgi:integrase
LAVNHIKLPSRLRQINGKYYWRPTKAVKALGFAQVPLGNDLNTAISEARRLNLEVDAARNGLVARAPIVGSGTVAELIHRYLLSPKFAALKPATQRDYRNILNEIENRAGHIRYASISRKDLKETYEKLLNSRSLAAANRIMRGGWFVLQSYAFDAGLIQSRQTENFGLKSTKPRRQLWIRNQLDAFIKHAPQSIGLAVKIAYDCGQRQADILSLDWSQWDGNAFKLTQSKTGQSIAVEVSKETAKILNAIRLPAGPMIVSEATGKPYLADNFRHRFDECRTKASLPEDLQFRDLRRTVATELGNSGATDDQIRAVTGHKTRGSIHVYVVPTTNMAKAAQKQRFKAAKVAKK